MAEVIHVKSGRTDGRIALWERHPDHPTGEIFVGSDVTQVVAAARTTRVSEALVSGLLVQVPVEALKASGAAAAAPKLAAVPQTSTVEADAEAPQRGPGRPSKA